MTTYVYGASDDLIEIEGSLREEFNVYDFPVYVGFSDGTLLKVNYDGDWNIKVVEGQAQIHQVGDATITEITYDDKFITIPDYSDLAIIHNDVTWVVSGTDVIK